MTCWLKYMNRKNTVITLGLFSPIVALAIAVGAFWKFVILPQKEHELRIQNATEIMQSFAQEDWKELYDQCMLMLTNRTETPLPQDQWPSIIEKVNPYFVIIRDHEVWMNWTGGFDEFSLSLHAIDHGHEIKKHKNESLGILIDDTRNILPRQPYVLNSQPFATGQRR